jgi:hypothetical protein
MAAGASAFLALFLVVGLVVGVVVIVLVAARRRKRVAQPSCGACRYPVAGLEVLRCPECGADLRTVGILTPANSGPSRTMIATLLVVAWSLALPLPAIFATLIVARALTTWSMAANATLTPQAPSRGHTVDVRLSGTRPPWERGYEEARVTALAADGTQTITLRVELDGDRAVVPAARGEPERAGALDVEIVRAWMERAGIADVDDGTLNAEARSIVETVRSLAASSAVVTGPGYSVVNVMTSSRALPPVWFTPAAIVFWLAVWSAVVLLIVRRARAKAA